ncbi:MAG: hypothetical protein ACD_79C00224G0006 [uncultured bacterium]|nr:MAG: hypothetical protein ACD_79C00224G0006 [uncultured bacterium]
MLGFKFIKFQPNNYVMMYKNGKIVKEGIGLSFFYFAPTSSLVSIPIGSIETPFIFSELTSDFQSVSIQGQISYKIADPKKLAQIVNYTLDNTGMNYISDDPAKLSQRVITVINVMIKKQLERTVLKESLKICEALSKNILNEIKSNIEISSLGIEIMGLSIIAIKPTQETGRALEATAREQILKEADDAIYLRRNAAVEQERSIKENELNTEIAVENKKRQIQEAKKEAEKAIQQKEHELQNSEMTFKTNLEEKKKKLVELTVENSRSEADVKAYAISTAMKALEGVSPSTIQSLASMGMQPDKLIALAFQGLAEKAEKIGQLNVTPDLLKEILSKSK